MAGAPRLLVTGFGPFPGAPENPTEALIHALAARPAEAFGASAVNAVVLPTDYQRSWDILKRLYAEQTPDVVVHFGLSRNATAIHIETVARNRIDPAKPDLGGLPLDLACVLQDGPATIGSTFPADAIVAALTDAGIPAALSLDAGAYVCNATLYRSLHAAPPTRRVGFIHVPPASIMDTAALERAATLIIDAALS